MWERDSSIARMIRRRMQLVLEQRLGEVPAVVLTGPRQSGKTTLALAVAAQKESVYLDLESPKDRAKLTDPERYVAGPTHPGGLFSPRTYSGGKSMTPALIEATWKLIDRPYLECVVRGGPQPVFATISGAHLYGFASPDSDIDIRGAFLLSARDVLGLRPAPETITVSQKHPVDLDWVAHDVRKFCRLLTSHNGYVLEQLFSPLVLISSPAFEELRELGRGCVTRPTVTHYLGFARGRRKRLHEPDPTVKHLLYAYRILLTGIHMMQTGEVVSNLQTLDDCFGIGLGELIGRKISGAEVMLLETREVAFHDSRLVRLEDRLLRAHEASSLPEEASTVAALEDFVIRQRLSTLEEER